MDEKRPTEQEARDYFSEAFQWIPIDLIDLLPDRQRARVLRQHVKLLEGFDVSKLDLVRVTPLANGRYSCNNGGHRLGVLREIGWENAPCLVGPPRTPSQERMLFLDFATGDLPILTWDKYRIALGGNFPPALAIQQMADEFGLEVVANSTKAMQVTPGVVIRAYQDPRVGEAGIAMLFTILTKAFPADADAYRLNFERALLKVVARFLACPQLDLPRLLTALQREGLYKIFYDGATLQRQELKGRTKMTEVDAWVNTIQEAYNLGLPKDATVRWK